MEYAHRYAGRAAGDQPDFHWMVRLFVERRNADDGERELGTASGDPRVEHGLRRERIGIIERRHRRDGRIDHGVDRRDERRQRWLGLWHERDFKRRGGRLDDREQRRRFGR